MSIVMYFVRTVCELIRLNKDTGPPARMHEEIFRVFAVFFEGFDMMVTGADSKVAQGRAPSKRLDDWGGGGETWSCKLKLFALAVPVTCKNLKLAIMFASKF